MKYVYGPVPSRRLGFSLGVDIVPYKACTLDCIYCQLGRTTRKVIKRKPYTPKEEIFKEIRVFLNKRNNIDFITFSGSGEPTLNSEIGGLIRLIKGVKEITSIPVAILTNGTLLFMKDVQKDLLEADVVLPSLDAASQHIFKRINRPHNFLNIESIINGLKGFRKIFCGQIWLEIMLIKGFNDDSKELLQIKKALSEIQPDKVHLNTVIRPPSEKYASPLNPDEMRAARDLLGEGCEIIAEFHGKGYVGKRDLKGAIIEMTKRRPMTITDIANLFGLSEANATKMMEGLNVKGLIREIKYKEKRYYSFKN
jgi:wyosine [tRNA(Phe)-imidazoG37] synthetase (radical SAM superfamily)